MADETIITLTADIVSAHVSNNSVTGNDLPLVIQSVFEALSNLGKAPEPVEEKLVPAVSIRSSVKPDAITCLDCGQRFKMLKRHLNTDHGLTPADYKARWGLNADYPLVAPQYAAQRADLAKKIGLGRKPGTKLKKAAAKPAARAPRKKAAPAPVAEASVDQVAADLA